MLKHWDKFTLIILFSSLFTDVNVLTSQLEGQLCSKHERINEENKHTKTQDEIRQHVSFLQWQLSAMTPPRSCEKK
jgi:hypothetical protein